MAIIINKLFIILFSFLFIAVNASEFNSPDFKLSLDEEWIKITDADLRQYEEEVLALSNSTDSTVYQYGFQSKNVSGFTNGPFILINVQRIINDKNINLKALNEIESSTNKIMNIGNATYDNFHKHYWSTFDDNYNQVEKYKVLLIQKLAKYGKVNIYFYAKISEFPKYEPLFRKIASSLSFKKEDDFQLFVKEQIDKEKSKDETFNIIILILSTVVPSIVIFVLKVMSSKKNQNIKNNAIGLTTKEKIEIQVKPPQVVIENNTKNLITFDRKGKFIPEEEEIFINNELESALLMANYRISKTSGRIILLALFIGVIFPAILYSGLIDELMGVNLKKLHDWKVYLLIPFISFILSLPLVNFFQNRAYLKERANIQELSKKSCFSKYKLITRINRFHELNQVSICLKKDTESNW